MNDVGKGVPIRNVLGVLWTIYSAVPEFYRTACADERSTHREQDPNSNTYNCQAPQGGVEKMARLLWAGKVHLSKPLAGLVVR